MLLAAWTDKFGDITKPGVALPIDYEIVLARFEHRLEEIYVKQADELGLLCGSLSTFENYFEASTTWPEPSFRIVAESSDSFRKDKLFWNIHELRQWLHYNSNSRSFHFAHIDKIIARSPEEKTRVDQLLLDHLSDMAATDQALSAIKYHRSRRTIDSIDLSAISSNEDPEADETETFVRAVTAEKGGNNALWKKLKKFADLPKPSDPPTRESVTHLVALQTGLQEYWEEVRSVKTALMKGIKMPSNFIFAYMFSISLGLTDAAEAGWEEDRKELLRLVELRGMLILYAYAVDSLTMIQRIQWILSAKVRLMKLPSSRNKQSWRPQLMLRKPRRNHARNHSQQAAKSRRRRIKLPTLRNYR